MKILHRFGYYFGGFAIGLVILAFFLNGRGVSCEYNYGPEARVLKNIRTKTLQFSAKSTSTITSKAIDTAAISYILKKGDVDFSKSEPRKEPCGLYYIYGETKDNKHLELYIENCDSIATLQTINLLN
ncbi:DUF4258 domain-containing protein [Olleya sp. HaHaR_3_96]|uniref:DUF4258 domain-containing protein n=1 Tax=Olleya sp. HaHaR_3_96 TaxID=2745560 RepID=UPI001C4E549B|nr:DUF4258 domain-containing protein [Olleya sp. HaHaR_3_96]QXP58956.1 DUF4258 domain-containing protein [Olleya sp. HaHaR_3_96]